MRLALASVFCLLAAPALAQGEGAPWAAEPDSIHTEGGVLHGTLVVPDREGSVPVVLIVAGSGPTDRDGNQAGAGANTLLQLAEALAQQGVASLRFDKRGMYESESADIDMATRPFDRLARDVVEWTDRLQADPRFSTVTIAGHSEGALFALIAARQAGADAVVSIAGVGAPAHVTLRRQLTDPRAVPPAQHDVARAALDSLALGRSPGALTGLLAGLFSPTIQPYLINWFAYDPAAEASAYPGPLLIVQGTTDFQVEVADAEALAAARPDARLVVVEGMNHMLKHDTADRLVQMTTTYVDPSHPVDPALVEAVSTFVLGVEPLTIVPAE